MKAELTYENKARFFALYWGQEVFCFRTRWGSKRFLKIDGSVISYSKDYTCYLELKPLSLISDDDAIEVAKVVFAPVIDRVKGEPQKYIALIRRDIKYGKLMMNYDKVDFLRSRGYALPWMGLTVDEMVEAGWIKLIEQ